MQLAGWLKHVPFSREFLSNRLTFTSASVKCRVVSVKGLLFLYHCVDYIFSSPDDFGKVGARGVGGVATLISAHRQTQQSESAIFVYLMHSLLAGISCQNSASFSTVFKPFQAD